ncbi:MAG: uL15 family ribosomal protein [Candidatus Bathyarchaeia archaeon]|nr:uL15 family ribosomal protein [Candidatus Bathyarchaeota archaeon]
MPHGRRKTRKLRGSRTHGYGRVGQHRKSGGRGGKGKAGGRDHFWIRTVKYEPNRFRRIGFKPPSRLETRAINTGELEELVRRVLGAEMRASALPELDLTSLGYDKLLGKGDLKIPLKIKVSSYTSMAREKVESAGGEIVEPQ